MMISRRRFLIVVVLAVAADVVTKAVAVATLSAGLVELAIIDLSLVRNNGVAFGAGSFLPPVVLIVLTAAVAAIAALAAWRGVIRRGIASGLIVGGAVANLADRIIDGSVIDMFDLGWWPAFNVADVCIVVGVGVLLLQSLRQPGPIAQGQPS